METVVSTFAFHEKTPQTSIQQRETPPSTWGLSTPHGSGEKRLVIDLICCFHKGKKRPLAYIPLEDSKKKKGVKRAGK